jgi:hypothetical protein
LGTQYFEKNLVLLALSTIITNSTCGEHSADIPVAGVAVGAVVVDAGGLASAMAAAVVVAADAAAMVVDVRIASNLHLGVRDTDQQGHD